jgi:uncharacterized protein
MEFIRVRKSTAFFVRFFFVACAMVFFAGRASAASFDCRRARVGVEQAICFSPQLSQLDELMASLYQAAWAGTVDKQSLRQTQRDWLRLVRNQCTTEGCLRIAYGNRIGQLRSGTFEAWARDSGFDSALAASAGQPGGANYLQANPADAFTRDWMAKAQILEYSLKRASQWVAFNGRLRVIAATCGQQNAFYSAARGTVVICYELVTRLLAEAQQRVSEGGDGRREANRLFMAVQFAVVHELGHAAIAQVANYASMGREETEADTFSSVVLLNGLSTEGVVDAIWAVRTLTSTFTPASFQYENYADAHELGPQRMANFACLAGGSSKEILPNLIGSNLVTKQRGPACATEWSRAHRGVLALSKQASVTASR